MSFIMKRGQAGPGAFHQGLTAQESAQVLMLNSLREIPKSRYATQLAITQIPSGRGRKAIFSHVEVYKMVENIANDLRETGVRPGTVCAMVAPNSIEAIVYFLAVQWVGAIAAPVDETLSETEMKAVLQAVGAFTVVSPLIDDDDIDDDEQNAKVTKVAKELDIIHWNIYRTTNKGVQLEQHKRRAGKDAAWKGGAADFKIDSSEISVHLGSPGSFDDSSPRGGSTLVAPLSHANMAGAAKTFANTYELTPENNATILTTPMHSIHTLVALIGTLYSGGHIVVPGVGETLSPEKFCAIAKDNKVSWATTNSDFVEELYTSTSKDRSLLDGVSLRFVRCHAGHVSGSSLAAFETCTGAKLLEAFGTVETCGMATSNTLRDNRPGSSGKAVKTAEIGVFDTETKKKLPAGKPGDVGVRSVMNMKGYLNNDGATDAFRIEAEDNEGGKATFMLTGSRGMLDKDGYLTVNGDSKELRAAEEEVRSMKVAAVAAAQASEEEAERKRQEEQEKQEKREAAELEARKEREAAEAQRAKELEEEAEQKRKAAMAAVGVGGAGIAAGVVGTREWNQNKNDGNDGNNGNNGNNNNNNNNGGADAEAMAKILERLQCIEEGQKQMEAELKAKHAKEMEEMQRLLEETQAANRQAAANASVPPVAPVMNMNMDEVNAAVNAASLAAQDSSRHTAEAAEAAKRAALAAEEASKNTGPAIAPLDPNANKVEVFDPNNVQKTVTVSLDEVEEAMEAHPAVGVARAFGRPDPRFGSEIYCCVLPKKGARVSEPWLKLHAQSVLPAACVPKKFFYREDLKTDTERRELSEDNALKRISHHSGYSNTKMVKSPAWTPGDGNKKAAA